MSNGNTQLKWRKTNAPVAGSRTDDIWCLDADTSWAVNSDGKILKTTDGWASFQEQFHANGVYLRCMAFAGPDRGWVGTLTPSNRMYETDDGGQTWRPVDNLPDMPAAICGLSVVNESLVYGSGTNFPFRPAAIIKTSDGGASWIVQDMSEHASLLVDIYFPEPDRGWVVGGKAPTPNPSNRNEVKPVVLFTEDGGSTWQPAEISSPLPNGEWGWKIFFVNELVGYVSLENFNAGAVLKTTDGGKTWVRKPINDQQGNANLEGVGFVDENHGWVGGWGDVNFRGGYSSITADGGEDWANANEIGKFLNRFRFLGNPVTVGYASGDTVYKYSTEPVPAPAAGLVAPAGLLQPGSEETERPVGDCVHRSTVLAVPRHRHLGPLRRACLPVEGRAEPVGGTRVGFMGMHAGLRRVPASGALHLPCDRRRPGRKPRHPRHVLAPSDGGHVFVSRLLQRSVARRKINMATETDAREAMIDLLKSKRPAAQAVHGAIFVNGDNLSQLFVGEKYDEILAFLETAKSQRLPGDLPLVVKGKPDESAFVEQITSGVMAGKFNADEIAVVESWIESLEAE